MAAVLTVMTRVKDWQALRRLNSEALVGIARESGATRYQLYRNVKDAAQVLIVVELPDHAALEALSREVAEQLGTLLQKDIADDRVWEATDLEGIG